MTAETVSPCPCCGAYSVHTLSKPPALLAVCDILVVHALTQVGKRIVRSQRSHFSMMKGRPYYVAHTLWQPDNVMTEKALNGAWDVVPAMLDNHGCCGVTTHQVVEMLDQYVRDLLRAGSPHNLTQLRTRFEARLNLSVSEPVPYVS